MRGISDEDIAVLGNVGRGIEQATSSREPGTMLFQQKPLGRPGYVPPSQGGPAPVARPTANRVSADYVQKPLGRPGFESSSQDQATANQTQPPVVKKQKPLGRPTF